VVAVVNRIRVTEGPIWNFAPAIEEIRGSIRKAVRALPTIGLALIILLASLAAARTAAGGVRRVLAKRLNPMILGVASRAVGLLTFLVGLYLVLHVAGLTRLAATVIGGTGIAGLVAGIAFRDILENYLASVLISLRNPFRLGDVVDIGGHLGVVQRVTSRGTVLMDMDGNHIQIPNATVYKSVIHNFTANPNRRDSFRVGIGYDSDIADAQRIALDVLEGHPAVLPAPEALVLADDLGPSAINLTFYYWYDGTVHNGLKIKSSLIRLVKTAFQDEGVSMPDEAREIVFPEGVPVRMKPDDGEGRPRAERPASSEKPRATAPAAPPFTSAEGETASEAESIRRQARHSRNPEESPDLLADDDAEPAS
jgi:small-conductance mechanosensitive channel